MQMTLARQLGFAIHLARGRRHFLKRQPAMAAPSAALAGWIDGKDGMLPIVVVKEMESARRVALIPFCSLDMKSPSEGEGRPLS